MAVNLNYPQAAPTPIQPGGGFSPVSGTDYPTWLSQQGYKPAGAPGPQPVDPGLYNQWINAKSASIGGETNPQTLGNLTPFFIPPTRPTTPWDPYNYAAPLALRNTTVAGIESQMPMGQDQMPYENSPGNQRLLDTVAALEHMARGQRGGFGSEGAMALTPGAIEKGGYAGRSALLQQEPGRLNALLQLLMGEYTGGGSLLAQQLQQEAASRQIQAGSKRSQAEALSQIPIVGSLVGGGFI